MTTSASLSAPPPGLSAAFLAAVDLAVGPRGWTTDPPRVEAHLAEQWGTARGTASLLLRPADTAEVAALMGLCHGHGVPVVPQGGNTGLVGAGVPDRSGRMVVLSLGRLNRIRDVDPLDDTITAEAGCVLAAVQSAAAEVDRLLPLSLGAQGSCQIGGNLSSNAGGVNVLRYGMARQLVLGLEVVLADGRIWDGLRRLRKDNTGYDLKQLFIGAEGTLGVITAAVLRLSPCPREVGTAWLAVPSPQAAVELLALCRARLGETISSFELMSDAGIETVLRYIPGARSPLAGSTAWHVLIEVGWALAEGLTRQLEQVLAAAMDQGLVDDGVVALSEAQRQALWALRENHTDAMASAGVILRHDVAVPVSRVPELIARGQMVFAQAIPGVRIMPFGHVGDGNIHYNLLQPAHMSGQAFRAMAGDVQRRVFDLVEALGGSISAEHGIGRLKQAELERRKPALELELMRRLKTCLDPEGLLNPGAVIRAADPL